MKANTFLILVLLFNFFAAPAQETEIPKDGVWSLRQCIDYAVANNLSISRTENSVRSSEVDYRQSLFNVLPSVNANVSYGYNWGRSVNPVTYQYTTQELNSINPGISASMSVFNGLRIQNTVKQNSRSLHASEQDLQKTKNDVMLSIASFYITVIFNKEQLENAKFQLESSKTQLDRIRKQVAAGALARSEELNMDAQVATNEATVIARENALNFSILQLKQALQLPASSPLDVELMDLQVEDLVLEQSRDEIYEVARQTMPEIRSARLRVESSDYAVKASRGSYYPRLTLNGSINSNYSSASDRARFIPDGGDPIPTGFQTIGFVDGTNQPVLAPMFAPSGRMESSWGQWDQLQDNVFRSVSLTLSIPIFNNYQTRASVQRSVIVSENAKVTEKEVANTLRQNVENAYNDALAASKTYTAAQRTVAAREEAFRMMTQRYNSGAANSFEYQVSQNDFYQAQTDLTRAKFDLIFRKKVLDFYLGKPLDY
jgi:outer membrane protein